MSKQKRQCVQLWLHLKGSTAADKEQTKDAEADLGDQSNVL